MITPDADRLWTLWWRWVVAVILTAATAALIALFSSFILLIGYRSASDSALLMAGSLIAAIIGCAIGWIQVHVLKAFEETSRVRDWMLASGIGLTLGVVVSISLYWLGDRAWWRMQEFAHIAGRFGPVALPMGFLGLFQTFVLGKGIRRASEWIFYNLIAAYLMTHMMRFVRNELVVIGSSILIYSIVTGCGIVRFHPISGRDTTVPGQRDFAPRTLLFTLLGLALMQASFIWCSPWVNHVPFHSILVPPMQP